METYNEILSTFFRRCPSCSEGTGRELFNKSHKRLLDKAEFRTNDITFPAIVQGTREYSWTETGLRCYGVTWYYDATTFIGLTPTSVDALRGLYGSNYLDDTTTQGTPAQYYIRSGASGLLIGFDPIPDTSTSGGYPYAVAHVEEYSQVVGNSAIPSGFLDAESHLAVMRWLYCFEWDPENLEKWETRMHRRIDEQVEHLQNLQPQDLTRILPPLGPFTRRII